jgi:hypothetical protein
MRDRARHKDSTGTPQSQHILIDPFHSDQIERQSNGSVAESRGAFSDFLSVDALTEV